jgi:hypothetical protein
MRLFYNICYYSKIRLSQFAAVLSRIFTGRAKKYHLHYVSPKNDFYGAYMKIKVHFDTNVMSRLQPGPYSWLRDSQHTFGRSYISTFGRSYIGTLEEAILAHSEETTGTLGRSYPPSDFRLNIQLGISLSQNSSFS